MKDEFDHKAQQPPKQPEPVIKTREESIQAQIDRLKSQRAKPTMQRTLTPGGNTEKIVHQHEDGKIITEIDSLEQQLKKNRAMKQDVKRQFDKGKGR